MTQIVTRVSIWDEAEIVLFDETDYEIVKRQIDLKSTQLLISAGDEIIFEGRKREVKKIDFLMMPYGIEPQCQIVVTLKDED